MEKKFNTKKLTENLLKIVNSEEEYNQLAGDLISFSSELHSQLIERGELKNGI
jgi:hypothetical protein